MHWSEIKTTQIEWSFTSVTSRQVRAFGSGLLKTLFFFEPPSANLTSNGSLAPGNCLPLNIWMICSHFSRDSIRAKPTPLFISAGGERKNKKTCHRPFLCRRDSHESKNYPPFDCPCWSRKILVEITWPYWDNRFSKSVSLKDGGKFAMYKFVGSCSCCC